MCPIIKKYVRLVTQEWGQRFRQRGLQPKLFSRAQIIPRDIEAQTMFWSVHNSRVPQHTCSRCISVGEPDQCTMEEKQIQIVNFEDVDDGPQRRPQFPSISKKKVLTCWDETKLRSHSLKIPDVRRVKNSADQCLELKQDLWDISWAHFYILTLRFPKMRKDSVLREIQ